MLHPNATGFRPATGKQIAFANTISRKLGIPLPRQRDFETYRKFISDHANEFYNKEGYKKKNIDAAGVIGIDENDTVFDVLDKFFYALERFEQQDNSVEYWTEDGAGLKIAKDLGECNAMVLLRASLDELAKDNSEPERAQPNNTPAQQESNTLEQALEDVEEVFDELEEDDELPLF